MQYGLTIDELLDLLKFLAILSKSTDEDISKCAHSLISAILLSK